MNYVKWPCDFIILSIVLLLSSLPPLSRIHVWTVQQSRGVAWKGRDSYLADAGAVCVTEDFKSSRKLAGSETFPFAAAAIAECVMGGILCQDLPRNLNDSPLTTEVSISSSHWQSPLSAHTRWKDAVESPVQLEVRTGIMTVFVYKQRNILSC